MALPQKHERVYTWSDYQTWPDDEHWEIVDGHPYAMAPAPTVRHQALLTQVVAMFHNHFSGRKCRSLVAPVDVRLSDVDVVEPDLIVVCDPRSIRRTHIEGAPSLVLEVISPGSAAHDRVRKLRLYAAAGIAEYWLVTPAATPIIEILTLDSGGYRIHGVFTRGQVAAGRLFPDLQIPLDQLVDETLPPDETDGWEVRESAPPYPHAEPARQTVSG